MNIYWALNRVPVITELLPCSLQPREFQGGLSFTYKRGCIWQQFISNHCSVPPKPTFLITGLCVPLSVPAWLLTPALLPVQLLPSLWPSALQSLQSGHTLSVLPSLLSPVWLLSFATVGTDLFSHIHSVSRFSSVREMNCYFFWLLFAFCHLMQDCALQGLAHPNIPKFLPSSLRPHDQIFTLASTSVGLLLPQSESVSILRTPTARSTPDTSNGFRQSVTFAYAFQIVFLLHIEQFC